MKLNLHGIAGAATVGISPWVKGKFKISTGYATNPAGGRVPTYSARDIRVKVQSLTSGDVAQMSGLNIQGERRALYLTGDLDGVSRPDNKGGDLVLLPDGSIWLVVFVLENWYMTNGWMKVAVTRQNNQ